MIEMWSEAYDNLHEALRLEEEYPQFTRGQFHLKVAHVKALLAIGQELSAIRHHGIAQSEEN